MSALHAKGFPVPRPIDANRHCVVMELAKAYQVGPPLTHTFRRALPYPASAQSWICARAQLNSIQTLRHPATVFNKLMELIIRLGSYGLIHCDFNEFNLLVDDDENVTLIDFPQMISTSHPNARSYFDRDVACIETFFRRRFDFVAEVRAHVIRAQSERNQRSIRA